MRDNGRGVDGELRRAANAEPDPSLASSPPSAGHGKTRFADAANWKPRRACRSARRARRNDRVGL